MRNLVPLNDSITIFHNENAFFIIFVYFITIDDRTCHFLHFDSCFPIETNHMVVYYWTSVVLSDNEDPIESVSSDADIFTDHGFA